MSSTISTHEYTPAKETDGRGPCPGLNALANHGYIPRDGKNITTTQLVSAITSVYNISYPLAYAAAFGGIAMCGHGTLLDLEGLLKHNVTEHDASLVHADLDETGGPLPSNKPDHRLIQAVIDLSDGDKVTLDNLIRHKYNREVRLGLKKDRSPLLNFASHSELVVCSHALDRDGTGISVEWFKTWFEEERLPEGLAPPETLGAVALFKRLRALKTKLDTLHAEEAKDRRDA